MSYIFPTFIFCIVDTYANVDLHLFVKENVIDYASRARFMLAFQKVKNALDNGGDVLFNLQSTCEGGSFVDLFVVY